MHEVQNISFLKLSSPSQSSKNNRGLFSPKGYTLVSNISQRKSEKIELVGSGLGLLLLKSLLCDITAQKWFSPGLAPIAGMMSLLVLISMEAHRWLPRNSSSSLHSCPVIAPKAKLLDLVVGSREVCHLQFYTLQELFLLLVFQL